MRSLCQEPSMMEVLIWINFPQAECASLQKKMESFKATVCHIKQVAGDPQGVQINLLRHQHTELPAGKYKKQSNYNQHGSEGYQVQTQHKKEFDAKCAHQNKNRCSKCGDTALIEGFHCPAKISM